MTSIASDRGQQPTNAPRREPRLEKSPLAHERAVRSHRLILVILRLLAHTCPIPSPPRQTGTRLARRRSCAWLVYDASARDELSRLVWGARRLPRRVVSVLNTIVIAGSNGPRRGLLRRLDSSDHLRGDPRRFWRPQF